MSNLRKAVIKLASENPGELRDALLPLLKSDKTASGGLMKHWRKHEMEAVSYIFPLLTPVGGRLGSAKAEIEFLSGSGWFLRAPEQDPFDLRVKYLHQATKAKGAAIAQLQKWGLIT